MGIDDDIQPWLRFAESDMASAEALHRAGQELNALLGRTPIGGCCQRGGETHSRNEGVSRMATIANLDELIDVGLARVRERVRIEAALPFRIATDGRGR